MGGDWWISDDPYPGPSEKPLRATTFLPGVSRAFGKAAVSSSQMNDYLRKLTESSKFVPTLEQEEIIKLYFGIFQKSPKTHTEILAEKNKRTQKYSRNTFDHRGRRIR